MTPLGSIKPRTDLVGIKYLVTITSVNECAEEPANDYKLKTGVAEEDKRHCL